MSTSDAPDWSNSALITGSLPASGPAVTTVPTTVESIVSIVEAAGTWFLAGQSNASVGPGGTASQSAPAATGTEVYALDFVWCSLPSTTAAADLSFYLSANNYKLVNGYSTTTGRVVVAIPLNGLVISNTATILAAVHNASGSNTYLGIEYGFIGRVVTP